MFRVIVAGTRTFNNYELLKNSLDSFLSNTQDDIHIVSGKARGADTLGERYAKYLGYTIDAYPADWSTYGKSAGYIRNAEMAKNADALVAFWDGKSKGTKHMIDLAEKEGLSVCIVLFK